MKTCILAVLLAGATWAQNVDLAFSNSVTTGASAVMRGGAANQFHQLTIIASDITTNSCSGGWAGVIYLEASQDKNTWGQLGLSITADADNTVTWTSSAGSFNYIRVNYISGNTSSCALTAWYSGTNTGYPSFSAGISAPVQIGGNAAVYSGAQAVTATAAALASQALKQICFKANTANAINVYIGPVGVTTATGFELAPNQGACLNVANANLLYVVASTTGAGVTWTGTN